jgi:hypothetical protein
MVVAVIASTDGISGLLYEALGMVFVRVACWVNEGLQRSCGIPRH